MSSEIQQSQSSGSPLRDLRIGILGSPNLTHEYHGDILEENISQPLAGRIVFFFHYEREGDQRVLKIVLGQIIEVIGRNIWHEDISIRALVKRRGRLEYLSEITDIKGMIIRFVGAFGVRHPNLPTSGDDNTIYNFLVNNINSLDVFLTDVYTPPSSGKYVYLLDDNILRVIERVERGNIVYLGRIYGSTTYAAFVLRHFGGEGQ